MLYVVVEIIGSLRKEGTWDPWMVHGGVLAGLLVMYVTSLFVAL